MTRRDLIQKVILGTTSLIILPQAFTSCSKDATIPPGGNGTGADKITVDLSLPGNAVLNTVGGSLVTKGVIIANTGNDIFVAIDSTCTHMGCTIGYSLAANNFPCPCHGSVYSTTGAILNGPTVIPLKAYPVTKSGTVLTVSLA
ncbi:MAG: Rieske (2Fe-2S) protein [Bacteroidales bacterium]